MPAEANGQALPRPLLALLVVLVPALVLSGIGPYDRLTWLLEVAPVLVVLPLLVATGRTFPLTGLLYLLIGVHALILMLGGHYTYARVPPGFWLQDWLDLGRNHYDRLGHLAQGFIPAIAAREIFVRRSPLKGGWWLPFMALSFCLAFSAFYELIEWWTALLAGAAAIDFLGTQGDVWDTQWDMFLCGLGAVLALATLSRAHDRGLAKLGQR